MCAIEREDFETLGLDFKEHVAAQHNMWDYLFFRLYLEAKDPAHLTNPSPSPNPNPNPNPNPSPNPNPIP